jgi:hypothetical protein
VVSKNYLALEMSAILAGCLPYALIMELLDFRLITDAWN